MERGEGMARPWTETSRATIVCVDENREGVLSGRIYNGSVEEGRSFRCLTEFLREMEDILSKAEFPKPFTAQRTFGAISREAAVLPGTEKKVGREATFLVRVLFRQNATWQGSVTWQEGKQKQSFRSALELIFLINSALDIKTAS